MSVAVLRATGVCPRPPTGTKERQPTTTNAPVDDVVLAVLRLLGLCDDVGDVRASLGFRDGEAGAFLPAKEGGHDPLPEFVRAEMEDRTDADAETAEEAVQDPAATAARELTFRRGRQKGGVGSVQSIRTIRLPPSCTRRMRARETLTRSR